MDMGMENGYAFFFILFGLIACFWGYRIFKIVLGIIGFILGAYFVGGFAASYTGGVGIVALIAGLAGGLIGGSVFVTLYFIGIFFLGAIGGWVFGVMLTSTAGSGMHIILFIMLALGGGILAIFFQKLVIIVSTSLIGAWYMVAGAFTLMGSEFTPMVMFGYPSRFASFAEGPGIVMLMCWIALGVSGIVFQYRYSASRDKRG